MAIDMKAMRAKLSALKNGGGNRNVFWRPQDGDQDILCFLVDEIPLWILID